MKPLIQKINRAFDSGQVKAIFDHVRNFLYAALFLAAGSYSARHDEEALFGFIVSENLGMGVIAFGVFLMLLNLYGGIYRLSKYRHPVVLSVFLTVLYVLASIRIVEVIWNFRDIE